MTEYKMYLRLDCTVWSSAAGEDINIGTDELFEIVWEKPSGE